MKTLIIGGTFNPLHIGHLFLAEEAVHQEGFERVLFVPSHKPAHKVIEGTTPEQRLEMLRLGLVGTPWLIETCELYRDGVSYSIDTVRCVLSQYSLSTKPTLLLGDDLFESFHTWKDAAELAGLVELLVARRHHAKPLTSVWPHKVLDNKLIELSSTEIRHRVQNGRAWRALVTPSIAAYIDQNSLYRNGVIG